MSGEKCISFKVRDQKYHSEVEQKMGCCIRPPTAVSQSSTRHRPRPSGPRPRRCCSRDSTCGTVQMDWQAGTSNASTISAVSQHQQQQQQQQQYKLHQQHQQQQIQSHALAQRRREQTHASPNMSTTPVTRSKDTRPLHSMGGGGIEGSINTVPGPVPRIRVVPELEAKIVILGSSGESLV